MPTYGQWATPSGSAIGIQEDPAYVHAGVAQTGNWVPGGSNWSASMWETPTGAFSDTPVYNTALGIFVSSKTGRAFTGKHPQSGQQYVNGQPTGVPVPYGAGRTINPNEPTERYRAVNIEKNPEISPAIQALTDQLTKTASDSLKSFDEYKKTFQDALSAAATKSAAATNIEPLAADLTGRQERYAAALDAASRRYSDILASTAAGEQGVVQEARDLLPQYDIAAANAADLAAKRLQANVSRYRAASGTPMGLGSAEQELLAKGAADIYVPMEQAKIAQRYNVLSQYAMPSVLDIANRYTAKAAQFDPMIAAQQFASGTQTAETIQQLKTVTANMAYQDAVRYMQAIGVPDQIQQAITSANIGNAAALNKLLSDFRYQGMHDILGAQITPSIGTTFIAPGYPGATRYTPSAGTGTVPTQAMLTTPILNAPNAPRTVGPANGQMVWDANNQRWVIRGTLEPVPWSRYGRAPVANVNQMETLASREYTG